MSFNSHLYCKPVCECAVCPLLSTLQLLTCLPVLCSLKYFSETVLANFLKLEVLVLHLYTRSSSCLTCSRHFCSNQSTEHWAALVLAAISVFPIVVCISPLLLAFCSHYCSLFGKHRKPQKHRPKLVFNLRPRCAERQKNGDRQLKSC